MQSQSIASFLFAVLALIAGMGLLFVRINPDQLRGHFVRRLGWHSFAFVLTGTLWQRSA